MAIPNVVIAPRPGNCCSTCGMQQPWAYRPRPEKPFDCGPLPALALSAAASHRRHLRHQLEQCLLRAQLPKERVAVQLLNLPATKFDQYLSGQAIPKHTQAHLDAIESVERNGSYVTVVYNVGPLSDRWGVMLHQRTRPNLPLADNLKRC